MECPFVKFSNYYMDKRKWQGDRAAQKLKLDGELSAASMGAFKDAWKAARNKYTSGVEPLQSRHMPSMCTINAAVHGGHCRGCSTAEMDRVWYDLAQPPTEPSTYIYFVPGDAPFLRLWEEEHDARDWLLSCGIDADENDVCRIGRGTGKVDVKALNGHTYTLDATKIHEDDLHKVENFTTGPLFVRMVQPLGTLGTLGI